MLLFVLNNRVSAMINAVDNVLNKTIQLRVSYFSSPTRKSVYIAGELAVVYVLLGSRKVISVAHLCLIFLFFLFS